MIENYRSGSAEGISLAFLTVWFIGDLANFLGSTWAGLVPTVIALAVYFCIADAVLITQCLYYHYVNSCNRKQGSRESGAEQADNPSQPLLAQGSSDIGLPGSRRRSSLSHKRRRSSLAASTLPKLPESGTTTHAWAVNSLSVFAVCVIGAAGWSIAWKTGIWKPTTESSKSDEGHGEIGAEILGYVSAVLYLG